MPDITHVAKQPLRRYLWTPVREDLARKMVFIGGPRQVGKTTFALSLLRTPPKNETHPAYMNWDRGEHRERLLSGEIPSGESLVLLDEIHQLHRLLGLAPVARDARLRNARDFGRCERDRTAGERLPHRLELRGRRQDLPRVAQVLHVVRTRVEREHDVLVR